MPDQKALDSTNRAIYKALKAAIISQSLTEKISETALMNDHRVSRNTARYLLNMLEKEGYLRRVRGKGSFPTIPTAHTGYSFNILHHENDFRDILRTGAGASYYGLLDGIISSEAVTRGSLRYLVLRERDSFDQIRENILALGPHSGLIITNPYSELDVIKICNLERIPFIAYVSEEADFNFINHNSRQTTFQAVTHLIQRGCHDLVFAGWNVSFPSSRLRWKSFSAACDKAGILPERRFQIPFNVDLQLDVEQLGAALRSCSEVPGIFISSNSFTSSVLETLKILNMPFPTRSAVIVFDDLPQYTTLQLSAVRTPLAAIGRTMVETLIEMFEFEFRNDVRITLPGEIVIRGSI